MRFIQLERKSFLRGAGFEQNLALKIFMGLIAVYFIISFLLLGVGLYPLLQKMFPEQKPLEVFNEYITFWFMSELVVRFLIQSLPVVNIKSFMLSNIRRKTIIHFVLIKSIFSFYNLLMPLVIIPFVVRCVIEGDYTVLEILGWLIAVLACVLLANYTNFLIKKKFSENLKKLIPYGVIVFILILLERFEVFRVGQQIGFLFDKLIDYPFLAIIPIMLVVWLYRWNFNYLKQNFYLDAFLRKKTNQAETSDWSWIKRFGGIAPFLQNDLKLIWRNKRPRSTVWLSFGFMMYGLFFYSNSVYEDMYGLMVFIGVFMTGIFIINFGQFIPAWDSGYYSMIMSQNIPMRQYLESKTILMYFSVIVTAILTSGYVYFGWDIFFINWACALYNVGINVPLILYAGSFNKKRIDMDKSPFMNYQGTGATQWILALPLLLIPMALWGMIYKVSNETIASYSLGAVGIIGLLLRTFLMDKIVKAYQKRKYIMISGFRQQEN